LTVEAAWLLFLGDFTPLSTASMLRAKAAGAPLGPIGAHAAVHSGLVAIAVALVRWNWSAISRSTSAAAASCGASHRWETRPTTPSGRPWGWTNSLMVWC
jgi:hypothetical protein